MKKITNLVKAFFADEKGAETVEWVMIAAVLSAIIVAAIWGTLQGNVDTAIGTIGANMTTNITAPAAP
jgi:Flp pilus assembly pilin Flp